MRLFGVFLCSKKNGLDSTCSFLWDNHCTPKQGFNTLQIGIRAELPNRNCLIHHFFPPPYPPPPPFWTVPAKRTFIIRMLFYFIHIHYSSMLCNVGYFVLQNRFTTGLRDKLLEKYLDMGLHLFAMNP